MPAPKRHWLVIRVVDYRLQALACQDDPCWEELSAETIVTDDREAAFQLARKYQGLLCSADGLPSPRQSTRFAQLVSALRDGGTAEPASSPANSASSPASASGTRKGEDVAGATASPTGEAGKSDGDPDWA